jgi:HEAT repeat protein
LLSGLHDKVAVIRENAVRLAEPRARDAKLVEEILPLANDNDARVRLQTAFTLGELNDVRAFDALTSLAERDAPDPWIRTAVLSSVAVTADQLLARLLLDAQVTAGPASDDLVRELAQMIGARGKTNEMQRALEAAKSGDHHDRELHVITGIGQGLNRSGKNLRRVELTGKARDIVDDVLSGAAQVAADGKQSLEARSASIRLLVRRPGKLSPTQV